MGDVVKQYTYRALIEWHDFPGRTGCLSGVFRCLNWQWMARKMAEAKIAQRATQDMLIDYSGVQVHGH